MNDDGRLIALSLASLYPIDRFVSLHRYVKKNYYSKLKSTIVQSTQELYYLLNVTLCSRVRPRNCESLIRLEESIYHPCICIYTLEFSIYIYFFLCSIYRIYRKNIQGVPSLAIVKYLENKRFLKKIIPTKICRTLSSALNSNLSVTINSE